MAHSRTGQRPDPNPRPSRNPRRVTEWVSEYNLQMEDLRDWLDARFPKQYELYSPDSESNRSEGDRDGVATWEQYYQVILPRALKKGEKNDIGRLRKVDGEREACVWSDESSEETEDAGTRQHSKITPPAHHPSPPVFSHGEGGRKTENSPRTTSSGPSRPDLSGGTKQSRERSKRKTKKEKEDRYRKREEDGYKKEEDRYQKKHKTRVGLCECIIL